MSYTRVMCVLVVGIWGMLTGVMITRLVDDDPISCPPADIVSLDVVQDADPSTIEWLKDCGFNVVTPQYEDSPNG